MPQVELTSYWLHPEGWFPVTVTNIEDADGKWGPQIKWFFETPEMQADEDGNPINDDNGNQLRGRLMDYTGVKASAHQAKPSKLAKLLLALGCDLPSTDEEAASMNDEWFAKLLGKKVQAKVVQQTMNDGRVFANIFEYKAVGSGKAAKASPAAASPPSGCPDPDYDHSLKAGDEGFDPFHSCPLVKAAA